MGLYLLISLLVIETSTKSGRQKQNQTRGNDTQKTVHLKL